MKILHVSLGLPPYRSGGLTKYSLDLMISQSTEGHDVSLIFPGYFDFLGKMRIEKKQKHSDIKIFEIVNPLPISLLGGINKPKHFMKTGHKQVYMEFLKNEHPDIIHVHTLMGIHKEFFEAAKQHQIKIVFTTHDYFGICAKVNLIDHTGTVCNDFQRGIRCTQCNSSAYSLFKIYLMQSRFYRQIKTSSVVEQIRRYEKKKANQIKEATDVIQSPVAFDYVSLRQYHLEMLRLVDGFHFNSTIAKEEYQKYVDVKGKYIPITHRDIIDCRIQKTFTSQNSPLRLTYLGPIEKYKGFFLLKESLDQLTNQKYLWHLSSFGDSPSNGLDFDPNYYSFHGKYRYSDLQRIFDQTDLLIIPSLWKETFGFIGLEALSHGIPVMISENVGFKDLIRDGKTGLIFKPSVDDLKQKILSVLENREILKDINRNINQMPFNFTMDVHVKEILNFYDEVYLGVKS